MFLEQYERMKRWYDKFSVLSQGRLHDRASDNYLDDVHAFFQNAYHLKDWIKRDATLASSIRSGVEAHINGSRSLRLCADICNSSKHLVLTQPPRSGENPTFGRKVFDLQLGGGPTTIALKWEINTSTGTIDAFDLATDCVRDWDRFRSRNGI